MFNSTSLFGLRGEWTVLAGVLIILVAVFGTMFTGFWAVTYVLDMFFTPAAISAFNSAAVAATALLV